MKQNEIELLNTVINHAYTAGYTHGIDECKEKIDRLEMAITKANSYAEWWQKQFETIRGDNETTGTDI